MAKQSIRTLILASGLIIGWAGFSVQAQAADSEDVAAGVLVGTVLGYALSDNHSHHSNSAVRVHYSNGYRHQPHHHNHFDHRVHHHGFYNPPYVWWRHPYPGGSHHNYSRHYDHDRRHDHNRRHNYDRYEEGRHQKGKHHKGEKHWK